MVLRFVRRAAVWLLPLALIAFAGACDDGDSGAAPPDGEGAPRSYALGYSSLPRELNVESYAEAIDFAANNGEVMLIQRSVPWDEFVPGGSVGDDTAMQSASEIKAVRDGGLQLFFAIDPTDGASGRDRLGALPVSLAGKRFDDPDIRAAFVSYAEYVALNYKPEYLALGVEMNLYYEKNKDDFENFKTLYAQAYDAVKRQSPGTQVTVTLQYEDLQGLLPREDKHTQSWELVYAFEPKIDFTSISTYPSFAFPSAADIPADYYEQLRGFTDRPIAIAEMGYSSRPGAQGVNSGTEADQAAFVRRITDEAEALGFSFAVWFAIWDPSYARDTEYAAFESIGLFTTDDNAKPAWTDWEKASSRPYDAAE